MKKFILLASFFISTVCFGQYSAWEKMLYDSTYAELSNVITFDDQSFITGLISSANGYSISLVKFDSSATIIWKKKYFLHGSKILKSADNRIIVLCSSNIFKVDTSGNIIWCKSFSTRGYNAKSIQLTVDSGFILSGVIDTIIGNIFYDKFISKVDSNGDIQWSKFIARRANDGLTSSDAIQTDDGGYLYYFSPNYPHPFESVFKLDSTGNTLRSFSVYGIGGGGQYNSTFVRFSPNKYLLNVDNRTICFDSAANISWSNYLEYSMYRNSKLAKINDSTGVIVGTSDFATNMMYLAKIDIYGSISFHLDYGIDTSVATTVFPYQNGYLIGGYIFESQLTVHWNPLLMRTNANAYSECNLDVPALVSALYRLGSDSLIPFSLDEVQGNIFSFLDSVLIDASSLNEIILCSQIMGAQEIESQYQDISIFPNPTNEEFSIENQGLKITSVDIYNLIGERIYFDFNYHSQTSISIRDFSPGIYFVKLETEKGSLVKKLVIE